MKSQLHWSKIGFHPHHGICLPLFSLRTQKGCGIGEFLDLIPLIDWCKSLGLDCLQLLPLNDCGEEASPYFALSSCALDPIYISLAALGLKNLESLQALNQQQRLNRHAVLQKKMELLRAYFDHEFSPTPEYFAFLEENRWVEEYAHYKALKKNFEMKSWLEWPAHPSLPDQTELDFYCFLQFCCFSQMETVRAHATKCNFFIKGDVPILLSPDSVDVWAHRPLFRLDFSAGSPPDAYNQQGQNWGSPLFNWSAMRAENFLWWKRRLRAAEKLFHIYRIDHVVGFFRIWGIPEGKKATEGAFFPPDPVLWAAQGKELLEMMLDATSLLPIAEDLGTIPPLVYPILKELGICGTKVIRWQWHWEHSQKKYIPYDQYEPLSMTTLSTPDLPPLELWWKKYPAESVPFAAFKHWAYHPLLSQSQRLDILRDSHHTASLFHINPLQEYLALFPELIWLDPEEERINIPGTLLPSNWTYRFRPSLEELIAHKGLADAFRAIL